MKRYRGADVDMWGAALVLYQMVEGVKAFETTQEIVSKSLEFRVESSESYKDFLRNMLEKDRFKRTHSYYLRHHQFMTTV